MYIEFTILEAKKTNGSKTLFSNFIFSIHINKLGQIWKWLVDIGPLLVEDLNGNHARGCFLFLL